MPNDEPMPAWRVHFETCYRCTLKRPCPEALKLGAPDPDEVVITIRVPRDLLP